MKTGKLDSLIEDLKKVLDKKSFEGIAVINYPRLLIQKNIILSQSNFMHMVSIKNH